MNGECLDVLDRQISGPGDRLNVFELGNGIDDPPFPPRQLEADRTDSRVDAPRPATRGETDMPDQLLVAVALWAVVDELTVAPPASSPVSTTSPELGSRLPGE